MTVSILALIVVAALLLRPALREFPLALGMTLVMVAASWLNVVLAYAVHYARLNVDGDVLGFPGERATGLSDYVYLSVGVQTTFATTDVEVRTRELRRVVTGQSLLAFVFTSVIVAIIISLIIGVA